MRLYVTSSRYHSYRWGYRRSSRYGIRGVSSNLSTLHGMGTCLSLLGKMQLKRGKPFYREELHNGSFVPWREEWREQSHYRRRPPFGSCFLPRYPVRHTGGVF